VRPTLIRSEMLPAWGPSAPSSSTNLDGGVGRPDADCPGRYTRGGRRMSSNCIRRLLLRRPTSRSRRHGPRRRQSIHDGLGGRPRRKSPRAARHRTARPNCSSTSMVLTPRISERPGRTPRVVRGGWTWSRFSEEGHFPRKRPAATRRHLPRSRRKTVNILGTCGHTASPATTEDRNSREARGQSTASGAFPGLPPVFLLTSAWPKL
jgi:hypothetical protein